MAIILVHMNYLYYVGITTYLKLLEGPIEPSPQRSIIDHAEEIQWALVYQHPRLIHLSRGEFYALSKYSHRLLLPCEFQLDTQPLQLLMAANITIFLSTCKAT